MEHMGAIIKRLRAEKGMTQAALAERLFVSVPAVSKWEREISAPDLCHIVPLTEIFGVSADELFGIGCKDHQE